MKPILLMAVVLCCMGFAMLPDGSIVLNRAEIMQLKAEIEDMEGRYDLAVRQLNEAKAQIAILGKKCT